MRPGVAVMTGGTAGLGLYAARALVEGCDRVLLGVRRSVGPEGAEAVPLDMARLGDVRAFADRVVAAAGAAGIDLLVLNAGGNFAAGRSAEGFEMNFAVNHLAHYLLLRLLLPHLEQGARVMITTSATHDPAAGAMIPAPLHADAARLAHPETDPERDAKPGKAAGRAYSAAKLCNIMTARALAARPEAREKRLRVIAYSPGPTPGTGLVQGRGAVLNLVWRQVMPRLGWLMPGLNSAAQAGGALADLALGRVVVPEGRIYGLLSRGRLTYPDPSALARDDTAVERLWRDSARLVGLEAA